MCVCGGGIYLLRFIAAPEIPTHISRMLSLVGFGKENVLNSKAVVHAGSTNTAVEQLLYPV